MLKTSVIFFLTTFFLLLSHSCEESKSDHSDTTGEENPFKDRVDYNGLELKGTKHETPNTFVEIWGPNDSLSYDLDGYLTDGEYDNRLNPPKIKNYSIIVYFDLNSPVLYQLAPGTYTFENSNERKPGIFNADSYIMIRSENKTDLFKITSGTIQIEEDRKYVLIEYELKVNNEYFVKGQYTGTVEIKDPYTLY